MTTTSIVERARAWAADDPDPVTRQQLIELLEEEPERSELDSLFAGELEFGTAGLRGPMGPGPARMNRVTVLRAAAALAEYLKARGADTDAPVVIGYDARHNSETFARDTAEIIAGAGFRALLLPRPLPTPVLAFTLLRLGCAAGVMVTASHNPAADNGYKVYLGDGCQIVPPADTGIADLIGKVGRVADLPRADTIETLGEDAVSAYVASTISPVDTCGPKQVSTVYTPLHGVAGDLAVKALRLAGFPAPDVVAAQSEPDPDFPTVAFPNPEEDGALDLAFALAEERGADLVLANDPDGDRCAVGTRGPHGWRRLHGDEVGALLGDFLLRNGVRGTYAATIVSSTLLGKLARAHGQEYAETLTGFKWIGRVPGLVFGYEEAIGYCVAPDRVRDKDGISALVRLVELAALLKAQGRSLNDRLDEIAREHGLHATDQLSLRGDPAVLAQAVARLRSDPPAALGGLAVERVDDLALGSPDLPPTDGLRFVLADGARVVVRPSGTEPKLKCYLEVVVPVEAGAEDGVDAARIAAVGRLDAIRGDLTHLLGGLSNEVR